VNGATPDVSVVIVNWNVKELLRDCLRSISEQTRSAHEVIVVDNASRDGSAEMVREEFPGVALIANAENKGFAAANNQGIAVSRGRYVLLLNPDTVIVDGAIDRTIAFADARPGIGCVGCQVWMDEETIQRTCFRFPSALNALLAASRLAALFPRSRFFAREWMPWWDRTTEREVDVVSGMYMLVPRSVVDEIGVLDEAFFVYAEEADWCFRMARAGHGRVFTPSARIIHREGGGKSTRLMSVKMYVQLQESLLIYHRKNLGRASFAFMKALFATTMAARALIMACASLLGGGERAAKMSAQSRAALRFHLFGTRPA